MSTSRLTMLLCDFGEDCETGDAIRGGMIIWADGQVCRQVAGEQGWTQREVDGEKLDFCPEHS